MIRKDLADINKLKQSTLKETIKYSFLYPESDGIAQSLQSVKIGHREPLGESQQEHEIPEEIE